MEAQEIVTQEGENKPVQKEKGNPNKITILELIVFAILVIGIIVYVSPNFLVSAENRRNAKIQTNASIFVSKVLSEFSANSNAKATEVAKNLSVELNGVNRNPVDKKNPAYSLGDKCPGCVIIIGDDKLNSITVSAYDNEGSLLTRTLIQPPSFVTYTKDLKKSKNKKEK